MNSFDLLYGFDLITTREHDGSATLEPFCEAELDAAFARLTDVYPLGREARQL
jgi:hypothetical protein